MTIFKEVLNEEFLTVAEAKEILADVETEQASEEDREIRYELARAIEHANRFAVLDADESLELVEELLALEFVEEHVAYKIADLLPQSRTEVRAVFAQERYALEGEELDEILDIVAKYA
ncbi:MAG: RNA polymerase Rpb4 family protein [Halodesulfurarchaeum sp.]